MPVARPQLRSTYPMVLSDPLIAFATHSLSGVPIPSSTFPEYSDVRLQLMNYVMCLRSIIRYYSLEIW
jgi:hypothetical protein